MELRILMKTPDTLLSFLYLSTVFAISQKNVFLIFYIYILRLKKSTHETKLQKNMFLISNWLDPFKLWNVKAFALKDMYFLITFIFLSFSTIFMYFLKFSKRVQTISIISENTENIHIFNVIYLYFCK